MSSLPTSRFRVGVAVQRSRRIQSSTRILCALLALGASAGVLAQAPPPPAPAPAPASPPSGMKDLGGGRYQVGAIVVDRNARQFAVPGRVLHIDDAPLEYIATSPGGMKAYETLLELDTTGTEFNLACILVGLDNSRTRRPDFQFDRRSPEGPRVDLGLRWQASGQAVQRSLQDVLAIRTPPGRPAEPTPPEEWVYTGSFSRDDSGQYAADVTGTLIGFVHDPASIIEHRTGLGIGAYGSVQGNREVLPPIGSAIELVVTVPPAAD